jgi:hypothetical protein
MMMENRRNRESNKPRTETNKQLHNCGKVKKICGERRRGKWRNGNRSDLIEPNLIDEDEVKIWRRTFFCDFILACFGLGYFRILTLA